MVVAHRGASSDYAEHTLAAYQAAIAAGADALECDVRLSRDGQLVCVHDRRVERTSNGHGAVSMLSLEQLNRLDFSSWHASSHAPATDEPATEHGSTGVLTLRALFELVHDAGREVKLLVETKHPTRYSGLVEKEVATLLQKFGWDAEGEPGYRRQPGDAQRARQAPVTVMSFAGTALRRMHQLAPGVPTVLLTEWLLPQHRGVRLPAGVAITGPGVQLLRKNPGYVQAAHDAGVLVYVWTVDEDSDLEFVRDLGVDGVITNRPAQVLARLADL